MELSIIVKRINRRLAGEMLTYAELEEHLDAVVDEINTRLNSTFPVFSEFNNTDYPAQYPNYTFFPDKYIRSVVIPGAAAKFYVTDEEGIDTAPKYNEEYTKNLFYMERDYSENIPVEFQSDNTSSVTDSDDADQEDHVHETSFSSAFML
jgi:hypothetical protein